MLPDIILRADGSVLPRALPWAIFGALEGAMCKWASNNFEQFPTFKYWLDGGAWHHPYAFHVYAMLIGLFTWSAR